MSNEVSSSPSRDHSLTRDQDDDAPVPSATGGAGASGSLPGENDHGGENASFYHIPAAPDVMNKGNTLFWRACHKGNIKEVKRLLSLGADVNTERNYYKTYREQWMPYDNGNGEKSNIEAESDDYWDEATRILFGKVSAFFVAVDEQHFKVAEFLLQQKEIDLARRYTPDQRTALYQAVIESGSEDLIKQLLQLPSASQFRDLLNYRCWSPLHYSAFAGQMAKARLLLQGGLKVNARTNDDLSPLIVAVRRCPPQTDKDMCRLLLMCGADVNIQDNEGHTPLHIAAAKGYARLVKLLLAWGADESIINKENKTALDLIPKDMKTLLDPTNVKKTKKRRCDPWKPLSRRIPPWSMDFSLKVALGRRSRQGSSHVKTYTLPISQFIYRIDYFPDIDTYEDQMEKFYISNEVEYDNPKDASNVPTDDIWKWIHIPSNNMTWIKDLLVTMFHSSSRRGKREEYWNMTDFFETSCVSNHGTSRQLKPHVKAACQNPTTEPDKWVSLAIPYIDFESDQYLDGRCKKTHEVAKHKRLAELWMQYPHFDGESGLQHPQTLDQSYYDGLQNGDLGDRNKDQVVYKWFRKSERVRGSGAEAKKEKSPEEPGEAKLLMVNQLWLWKLGDGTIITAFPDRWHDGPEHTLYEAIQQEVSNHVWTNSDAFIEFILSIAVTFPLISSNLRFGFDILEVFESWVGILSCQEMKLFKDFRTFLKKRSGHEGEDSISDTHLSITEEVDLTYELRDVVDELFILNRICTTQKDLLNRFLELPYEKTTPSEQGKGKSAVRDVEKFIEHTERLEDKAKKVLENLDKLVQIKQAQSSLNESRVASEEAERSHRLNNYIMLFTIVTVVFTPLSFMASMFALAIDMFPHNEDGEPRYISSWITGRLFAGEVTSLAVIIIGFLVMRTGRNKRRQKKLEEMEPRPRKLGYWRLPSSSPSNGGGDKEEGGGSGGGGGGGGKYWESMPAAVTGITNRAFEKGQSVLRRGKKQKVKDAENPTPLAANTAPVAGDTPP
ncbi:hypothetical protein QBC43DRAFT_324222 [Cladorrhinum sp. PSN259]|nr:hypothetical protein QBC43DRAFT_324222 [Cladorrhinum sp. PSN259]